MSTTTIFITVPLLGVAILAFALKFGVIGGGGGGARRDENPFLYWFGVAVTALTVLIAIFILAFVSSQP